MTAPRFDRLNIRTIDSLCSEIARSLPVFSGSGGRQSPSTDAAPLYALAARRTFLQLGGNDPALNAALRGRTRRLSYSLTAHPGLTVSFAEPDGMKGDEGCSVSGCESGFSCNASSGRCQ